MTFIALFIGIFVFFVYENADGITLYEKIAAGFAERFMTQRMFYLDDNEMVVMGSKIFGQIFVTETVIDLRDEDHGGFDHTHHDKE